MMDNVKKSKFTGKVVNSNWNDEKILTIVLHNSIKIYFLQLELLFAKQGTNLFGLEIRKRLLKKKNENSKAIIINDEYFLSKLG